MHDIFLVALGSIPLAIAVVRQMLHKKGISVRQLRDRLSRLPAVASFQPRTEDAEETPEALSGFWAQ